jgi:5-methylcytosine-specific restriction endonuclease McrA
MSLLDRETVLVLNRNWQAIHVKSVADALSMMYSGSATGLHILGKDDMYPCKWNEWINLDINEDEECIKTVRGNIKVPKIIVLCKYNQVPKKRPKFSMKGIWARDGGKCAYTGVKVNSKTGNVDHIIPRSRGGKTDWKNCVLTHRDINAMKANRTPEEANLKLLKEPTEPKYLPLTSYIKNRYKIEEWNIFLQHNTEAVTLTGNA